ncbi:RICIN domain-containing protein [Micromonospora sp. NBC_01412]|uniref:RICIN domain-containing protein n=1 Tax=Micromonospora sp. NBC_01412 TaxID=2903590 RepID=UPI00324EACE5
MLRERCACESAAREKEENMRVGSLKRVIARLAVVMVAIGAPAMVTATPAQAQYVSVNAWGFLYNETSIAHSLAVSNGVVNHSSNLPRQSWIIKDNAPNGHTIFHATGCLDSNRWGAVYILACNNGDYQRWHFNARPSSGPVRYEIINKATGYCLSTSVLDGSVYTNTCHNTSNQVWFIPS